MIFQSQRGFIALMSVVVISMLLLALTATMGFSSFFTRFDILDSESKGISFSLAEACKDSALLKLAGSKDYILTAPDHAILVGSNSCDIVSLLPNPSRTFPITIQTQASFHKAYTNLEIMVDKNFKTVSFKELPNF